MKMYIIKDSIEIWKDIDNYEGLYQISNFGRVKSLAKYWRSGKDSVTLRFHKEKILCQQNHSGYLEVKLCNNRSKYYAKVHRLVCQAFLSNPENKPEVNHKDGNPSNNYLSNLEWCTHNENVQHAKKIGLILKDVNHPASQLSLSQVYRLKIISKNMKADYGYWTRIAKSLCVSVGSVRDAQRNKTYKNILI
jgi:hypothetical protein